MIAMLSFSVRLVEVIDGFVSIPGPAYAASDKKETKPVAIEEEPEPKKMAKADTEDDDFPIWRDPADDDPSYEASKMEVFKDLAKRREGLESKEKNIQTREALLKAAEQELDRKYQELEQLRSELEGLLETQSDEEQKRIGSLVKIYEGMKPKDAARIFDTLDLDILVEVVAQMSERKLSPVLAAMNPERARTVTIMLAEQKQLPTLP